MAIFSNLAEVLTVASGDLMKANQVSGVTDTRSVGSSYGASVRPFREILGYSFTIEDPLQVLIDRPLRPINVPYLLANILWTAAGNDAVDEIGYWNPRATVFSDDGACIRSAPGPRLFGVQDQFALAKRRLEHDPSTRRAIVVLLDQADLAADTKDIPCVASLQFFLRDDRLCAIGNMRSQSALMVMPYDIPLLTSLQCVMARELGVAAGTYTHVSGSFHFYEEELAVAEDTASGGVTSAAMPMICSLAELQELASTMTKMQFAPIDVVRTQARHVKSNASDSFSHVVQRVLLGQILAAAGDRMLATELRTSAGALGRLCGPLPRPDRRATS